MKYIKTFFSITIFLVLFFSISCTKLDEEFYDAIPADKYPENSDQVATLAVNAYKR
jgi:hypothetical protein